MSLIRVLGLVIISGCSGTIADGDPPGDSPGDGWTAGDAAVGDPGDSPVGDPAAGDPVAGDSATGDPAVGDPAVGDPTGGDPSSLTHVFEEIGGTVAVEAEHFVSNDAHGTPRQWYLTTPSGAAGPTPDLDPNHADEASGQAYVEGLPDTRVTHDDTLIANENFFGTGGAGPILSYQIYFNTPGTYIVWARAYSTGAEDNGIHAGVDGTWPASGTKLQWCSGKNQWTWSSAQRDSGGTACGVPRTVSLEITNAGMHTITFSMREDGMEFDKWIMTTDSALAPSGAGPAERPYP